jgi:Tfp pilus assembly protein PilE
LGNIQEQVPVFQIREKKQGMTLLEITMVIFIIILLASLIQGYFQRSRIHTNDMSAQVKLRQMSTAIETYAGDHTGNYPTNMDVLHTIEPPYIDENYCAIEERGFMYSCSLWSAGYLFEAHPVEVGVTGTTTFMISTGGYLQ